ncbi:MAG: hypothetical protein WD021_05825 [Rhodothermales bacterium]
MSSQPPPPVTDAVDPAVVERLVVPDEPSITFPGFTKEAFSILERLRARPHIEQYQADKPAIRAHLKRPFTSYRDDLVVNAVLPNGLRLETERNVFSRLLKNDFGAGGCHHHMWMSFYRPARTRLTDLQLAHSIRPSGFRIAVIARRAALQTFTHALDAHQDRSARVLDVINGQLAEAEGGFYIRSRAGEQTDFTEPIDVMPEDFASAASFGLYRFIPSRDVVRLGGGLLREALLSMKQLWPYYNLLLASD